MLKRKGVGGKSLKRGGVKKNEKVELDQGQEDLLKESLQELKRALEEERSTSSRNICKGMWCDSPVNKVLVTVIRGNHFHNMGHSINGEHWLYPEEALFLLERGALTADFEGVPVSIQQAYMLMMRESRLTLEKYQVYAYLKRIGYTVTRPPPSSSSREFKSDSEDTSIIKNLSMSRYLGHLVYPLLSPLTYITRNFFSKIFSSPLTPSIEPMVKPGSCYTYDQVFKKLQIIQRSNDTDPESISAYNLGDVDDYKVDFYVYKKTQNRKFKKKHPGEPLFRVVVASADAQRPPSLGMLDRLFKEGDKNGGDSSSILFSIVSGANVTFLEFKDVMFTEKKVDVVGSE
ncbi:8049_t:CDS:2 [Acaulospora morrowiae]|uniref:8049_t:CDS:1 n=1 Tax=Acaulospora morrowiae TaxID=94023 RepID=A0A9N8V7X6_9GLOM|nr:8049_t:CDS:2 [Acaulospora morrowiae]